MDFAIKLRKWLKDRKEFEEDGIADKRRSICHGCEHYAGGWCGLCHCALGLKTLLIESHCPDRPPRW
jgi:hypothetical protein